MPASVGIRVFSTGQFEGEGDDIRAVGCLIRADGSTVGLDGRLSKQEIAELAFDAGLRVAKMTVEQMTVRKYRPYRKPLKTQRARR